MSERHRVAIAVYLVLVDSRGRILLLGRSGTGWEDDRMSLPAGHVEAGESAMEGMLRECLEEVGVTLRPANLALRHTMHRHGDPDYVDLYFVATRWAGRPKLLEPDKANRLEWNDMARLPANMIPAVAYAIDQIRIGNPYSEYDWPGN
ncbi:MAG: NUDIX domain-containing protein [Actinomycetales bacterium]|nr:NUDIX domain-containing protein [Actinomycetales bacterium]